MVASTFDTLKYAKRLESAGLSREQAELQTEIVVEAVRDTMQHYATEVSVTQFKSEMKGDFQAFQSQIKLDFQALELRIQKELSPMRTQMAVIMWTQGLIVLTVVVPAIKQMLGL
jgi:hypothetical protein